MTKDSKAQITDNLVTIAEQFALPGTVINVQGFGNGNINDTFLVTLNSTTDRHFVLQRINKQVFRQPQLVMQNMRVYTEHVHKRLQNTHLNRRWEVPRVISTQENQDYWRDESDDYWRAISFIDNSQCFETLNIAQASEVGYALGTFHNLISDLPPAGLADTLEGFHIIPRYLQHYQEVLANTNVQTSPEVNYCRQFVSDRQTFAHILEHAKTQGLLPLRLMHGDPKINNVMFDVTTQQAVSIIDLDTIKPGLVHYDIGDCLRSGCNPAGEETQQWESVYFEPDLCNGILQGYLSVAKAFLTQHDYHYIYDAIRLITFELGLRFFTDYLAGNVYFKIKYPEHNLARALVQFKLTESIESQEKTIRHLIQGHLCV